MPTANFYVRNTHVRRFGDEAQRQFREFAAKRLTCGDIALRPEEISIRLIRVDESSLMMGELELDMHAHEFAERVERQDQLCQELAAFLQDELQLSDDVKVWLVLSQLGHSV